MGIRAIEKKSNLLHKIFGYIKPYYGVSITFKFNAPRKTISPSKICRVTSENIDDALVYEPYTKVDTFRQFLEQGDWGYYAYIDDQWVHRSWVTFGPKTENQWRYYPHIKLNKGDAFIKWCETRPEARGGNVYPAVLSQIAKDLNDQTKNIYISTNAKNKASLRGISKAGYIPIRETRVISFLGIKYERIRILSE